MLTPRQVEFFDREGYLVVENVLDQPTLHAVREEYAELIDTLYEGWWRQGRVDQNPKGLGFWDKLRIAYKAGCDWFQPMDISLPGDKIYADTPFHFGPAVFDMVTNSRLLDMVETLIGPEITSNPIQHVRIKPPADDLAQDEIRAHITSTDWHQDRAVALAEADETTMVTVWLAISDATYENGCLQVLPRSHREGIKPHCPKTQTAIADGQIDESAGLPLPVRAGGAVLFHPLTAHASLTNRTPDFRWSFDLRYNVTGEPTGRSHFPHFIARSRTQPDRELRDWREWKTFWEDSRDRLAQKPHIEIHRWSSDSPACA
ncbi:MAG: phytanoyl-CoA dioxygenase family protein [Ahrensia sp.]|nr:phytanoyl-CoA dioxygenase family protein [Ahrensia sp.]